MKRTLLAAILATAAIAFSCSMEEPAQDNSVVKNPTVTIADFVYDGAYTKTTADFENNVASFAFEASDVLRAYPLPDGDGLRFTVKTPKGTACVFEGEGFGLEAGTSYAAYYPGDSETVPELTAVPVDFSVQSQPAASEWNLSDVDFLFATGIQPANGACEFSMKHLGALLIMDVTVKQSGVYKSLVLKSSEKLIPAVGTVDLTADEVVITPAENGLTDRITLALGGEDGMAIEAGETVTFYMMVPPVDLSNATLTLRLRDAAGNNVLTKDGPGINFEAGKAVEFGTTPLVNLSAVETANTYIVSAAGNYYFNATIAGNGQQPLPVGIFTSLNFGGNGQVYPSNGSGVSTGVSGNTAVVKMNQNNCISDVVWSGGKIYFTATGNEGVAKITLMDLPDGATEDSDYYVWTWTIWCTDQPAEVTIPTSDGSKSYTLLDRNIGAITAEAGITEAECGLYYMFGDPIGYTIAEWKTASLDGYRMLDEIARSPNKPYCDRGKAGEFYWFNPAASTNPKQTYAFLWGAYGTGAGQTWAPGTGTYDRKPGTASVKLMYDPCPVGYKVMAFDVLYGYNSTDAISNFTADESGVYIEGSNGKLFIPYSGNAWPSESGYNGTPGVHCYLRTSAHNNSNMAWCYMVYKKDPDRAGCDAANHEEDNSHILTRGMPVRCMKQ